MLTHITNVHHTNTFQVYISICIYLDTWDTMLNKMIEHKKVNMLSNDIKIENFHH